MPNMKKKILALVAGGLLVTMLFVQCKKSSDSVSVLKPQAESITFSGVSDFILDSTGKTISIQAQVASKESLKTIELVYQPWNIAKSIPISGTIYSFSDVVNIPKTALLQVHSLVLKATDVNGNSNFTEIKVGLQDLNYSKIYLTNVSDSTGLIGNLYGVPLSMNKTGSHAYEVIYYVKKGGEKIRFIPNRNRLAPVAIGADPTNQTKLITDASKSLPIAIKDAGYYKISVNTLLLNYSIEPYKAVGTPPPAVAFVGRGFFDYPNMNWQNTLPNIILMDRDSANPFYFTKTLRIGTPAGNTYNTAQFIMTTNNGWTDFWRFDNGSSPEFAVFNGGTNTELPITPSPTTYLFVFDALTNQVQAIKK